MVGAYSALAGAVVLLGWVTGLPALTDWFGSGIATLPNTAIASAAAGLALVLYSVGWGRVPLSLAVLTGVTGAATLFEHVTSVNLGVDTLVLVPGWGSRGTLAPGRMGPPAATSFTLIGAALVLMRLGPRGRAGALACGLAVTSISMFSIVGYLYGAGPLFDAPRLTAIAVPTSTILFALGVGIVALAAGSNIHRVVSGDGPSGVMVRRLLPFVIVVPFVIGWLRAVGERAGLYDSSFGTAVRTLAEMALLMALLWWATRAVRAQERARASVESDLAASERRLRAMIDALPTPVYTTDADGRIVHFNRAVVEVSGRTPEIGADSRCVTERMYDADGSPVLHDQAAMSVALREGRAVRGAEVIVERPDGSRRWCEPYATPVLDIAGRVAGAINMLVDVTERKRAEMAVTRLASIVQSSDDAIVSKSLDGVITSWNRGAERIFGYTEPEAIGRHITFIIPEERRWEEDEVLRRLRRGEEVSHFETVRRTKDGRLINVSLTVSPLRDSRGRIVGASKIARDITDRKQIEAALSAHHEELEHRVAQRTGELVAAHERLRLQDRMAAVGTLASGLAHDMKNVLMPLGVRLESVLASPRLSREAAADLAAVRALLEHLRSMASNLSLFSKDPNQEGPEGRTRLDAWCAQVRGFIDVSAGASVCVRWDIPEDLPEVAIAPHRLTQAALNLVHNARDAILARPGPLSGVSVNGRVIVEARADGPDGVALRVTDDGCGMTEDVRLRCLEPFFTTKDRPAAAGAGGGTGLGLSLAHAVVDGAGGTLEVATTRGVGTTVTLRLPIAPALETRPPVGFARVSIDDTRRAAIVRHTLETLGYELVSNGATAGRPESLWVTDGLGLPLRSATEFLRAAPDRRVIVLGLPDEAAHDAWRSIGAEVCANGMQVTQLRALLAGDPGTPVITVQPRLPAPT